MKKVLVCLLLGLLVISAALVACAPAPTPTPTPKGTPTPTPTTKPTPTPTASPQAEKKVTWATHTVGSSTYMIAIAVAQTVSKNTYLDITVQPTGGSQAMTETVGSGKSEFGSGGGISDYTGMTATGPFVGKQPLPKLRVVRLGNELHHAFQSRRDSSIYSISDLRGKRVAWTYPGSTTEDLAKATFKAHGMDLEKDAQAFKSQSVAAMGVDLIEGRVDAIHSSLSGAKLIQLQQDIGGVRVLPFAADKWATVSAQLRGYKLLVTPEGWPGVPAGVPVPGWDLAITSNIDVADDVVYTFVKASADFYDEFKGVHPDLALWNPKNGARPYDIPYHPGAIKYFKEVGLWTAEVEAANQKALAEFKVTR